jgi:hypothetical protein
MQDYITKDTLLTLGIDLTDQNVESLLAHLNEAVEERVGAEITESLSDAQLDELVRLQESSSDAEIGMWISERVPNYLEIVQDTVDITIGELADNADSINTVAA